MTVRIMTEVSARIKIDVTFMRTKLNVMVLTVVMAIKT